MLTIHGVPISVHTRKVIVAAHEKRLPFRNEPVIPFHPPVGWAELSPTGKIPVVTDGDLILRDSSVICAYLERTHPTHPLYPTEARAYAEALWLEEYADGTIFREIIHGLFFQNVIRPKILQQTTDESAVAGILDSALPKVFGYLEAAAAGDFLVDGRFGIADIAVVSNLINFNYLGFRIDPQRFPRLARYCARQVAHPSFRAALAAERQVASAMGLDLTYFENALSAGAA